jgi:hypothetical protein
MFDEIRVYEGIAERTGTIVDRDTVRGSKSVCHSVSELSRKYRRVGDGTFYLDTDAWPENETKVVLTEKWKTMG